MSDFTVLPMDRTPLCDALDATDVWRVQGPDGVRVVARRAGSPMLFCSCKHHNFCPHTRAVREARKVEEREWDTHPAA